MRCSCGHLPFRHDTRRPCHLSCDIDGEECREDRGETTKHHDDNVITRGDTWFLKTNERQS